MTNLKVGIKEVNIQVVKSVEKAVKKAISELSNPELGQGSVDAPKDFITTNN